MPTDLAELRHRFAFHPATNDATKEAHEWVRGACGWLAEKMDETIPDGREKAVVFTKLEEVMFWANAAIAREGGPDRGPQVATPYEKTEYDNTTDAQRGRAKVRVDSDGVMRAYDQETTTYWDVPDGAVPPTP